MNWRKHTKLDEYIEYATCVFIGMCIAALTGGIAVACVFVANFIYQQATL